MTTTPRLGAPELVSAQATPEATVNEQIRYVEQGASYFIVKDKDLTAAPGSPADGDAYIVATGATGTWSGKDGKIAFRMSTGWLYVTPIEGTLAYVQDENTRYAYNGSAWAADTTGGGTFTAASPTEVLTGTDTSKGVTPDALAALWEQGTDIASAATLAVGEGGYFSVTGTTTITDIDPATDKAGRHFILKFAGALTLTHNASTLILPTGANIVTAAGDVAHFVSEGADAVRCVAYQRASGAALTAGGNPTESIIIACSDETTALTTGTAKVTFRMPYAFTLSAVRASLTTAQTSGSIFTVDINEAGTTILSTKLTIDNTEKTSTTAATAAVISDSSLADDAEITVDIDQIGDGTAKGLKVVLIGSRT